jgi:hypothetical protein
MAITNAREMKNDEVSGNEDNLHPETRVTHPALKQQSYQHKCTLLYTQKKKR